MAGRGRPVGAVKTPRSVLQQDMREQARLNQRIREMLSRLLDGIEEELKTNGQLRTKLEVAETLGGMMAAGSKAIESTAKHTMGAAEGEDERREEVSVLEEMQGRKR